ncbi:MAG: NAD(P)-dependent glycerol-3-phosphate dehydrogenase [SAR202 cluster bacterium]|nr:NAD(P)-dependent glycerol-3-phosphate dehydrogenase [SAR202 cluster bacterium]
MADVVVIGTGSWGTTLALLLARKGTSVVLLARTEAEAGQLRQDAENKRFVPGHQFPARLNVDALGKNPLLEARIVLIAVPSPRLRENAKSIAPHLKRSAIVVSATKGLETETGKRMSQVLADELPLALRSGICALSGPNLAMEIAADMPSSTVVASQSEEAAKAIQGLLNTPRFRVYTSEDIVGVEFGGALKNIIAIGAGVCDGLSLGNNAKAAFLTRGLAEITRLSVAAGADPLTLSGLSGMGDLIATSYSGLSRNHYVGEQLAAGKSPRQIRGSMKNVAEGVETSAAAVKLAASMGVEMPIAQVTYEVLHKGLPLEQAIAGLLGRAPAPEQT